MVSKKCFGDTGKLYFSESKQWSNMGKIRECSLTRQLICYSAH